MPGCQAVNPLSHSEVRAEVVCGQALRELDQPSCVSNKDWLIGGLRGPQAIEALLDLSETLVGARAPLILRVVPCLPSR